LETGRITQTGEASSGSIAEQVRTAIAEDLDIA
jgi:hypothetical protein